MRVAARFRFGTLRGIALQELTCYVTLDGPEDDVLGFGVSISRHRSGDIKDISSPCEPLSRAAWGENGIRESSYRQKLDSWMPLYFNSEHMHRAETILREALASIATGSSRPSEYKPEHALLVLPKLLNSMIVDLARGDAGAKSLRLLNGFCQIHRLFLHLLDTDAALRDLVECRLRNFILDGATAKNECPNLGEWLVLLAVSDSFSWEEASGRYLDESAARNVRWYGRDHPQLIATTSTDGLALVSDKQRCATVFDATRVSRGLLCFSIFFLQNVARPAGRSLAQVARDLDRRMGQPAPECLARLQDAARRIDKIASWEQYYAWIGCPAPSSESELAATLRVAVTSSLARGYHQPPPAAGGSDLAWRRGGHGRGGGRGRGADGARGGRAGRGFDRGLGGRGGDYRRGGGRRNHQEPDE